MKRRNWTSKQKSQIVLEGLSGQIDITQLCQKYQVSQTQGTEIGDSCTSSLIW